MFNAFCFCFSNDTYSLHAKRFFGAWEKRERVRIIPFDQPPAGNAPAPLPAFSSPDSTLPSIGLGSIEPMRTLVGSRRIAFIVWETTIMPQGKLEILRSMDEIWTPSNWGRQLLIGNGLDGHKIRVVPEGVDVEQFKPVPSPDRKDRRFRFLCVGKWEARKGTADLVTAFCDEFRHDEPVELVLHCWNPYLTSFDLEENIRQVVGHNPPHLIASHPMPEDSLVDLYNKCDAFVLPTRAEAWGLPLTEAMACELPVIVTEYSAPLDYLDRRCAYLIPVEKMVPVHDPCFFPAGKDLGDWAQPDLQELRKLMRHVFENPAEAKAKGRLARTEVCNRWTWDHAVTIAQSLVSASG
jgi:glycosyltransferase involved in cell wall biosynthesis